MAKRKTDYKAPPSTELIISLKEFKDTLEKRIKNGEDILNQEIGTQVDFDTNRNDYNLWDDYNSEYLKQSFNNEYNEYKKRYDECTFMVGFGTGSQTPQAKLKNFKSSVELKLNNLKKLYAKADLLKSSVESKKQPSRIIYQTELILIIFLLFTDMMNAQNWMWLEQ